MHRWRAHALRCSASLNWWRFLDLLDSVCGTEKRCGYRWESGLIMNKNPRLVSVLVAITVAILLGKSIAILRGRFCRGGGLLS